MMVEDEAKGEPLTLAASRDADTDIVMKVLDRYLASGVNKQRIVDSFRHFDSDGNGCLDSEEFVAAISSLGVDLDHASIEGVFRSLDDDASGELSLPEVEIRVRRWRQRKRNTALARRCRRRPQTAPLPLRGRARCGRTTGGPFVPRELGVHDLRESQDFARMYALQTGITINTAASGPRTMAKDRSQRFKVVSVKNSPGWTLPAPTAQRGGRQDGAGAHGIPIPRSKQKSGGFLVRTDSFKTRVAGRLAGISSDEKGRGTSSGSYQGKITRLASAVGRPKTTLFDTWEGEGSVAEADSRRAARRVLQTIFFDILEPDKEGFVGKDDIYELCEQGRLSVEQASKAPTTLGPHQGLTRGTKSKSSTTTRMRARLFEIQPATSPTSKFPCPGPETATHAEVDAGVRFQGKAHCDGASSAPTTPALGRKKSKRQLRRMMQQAAEREMARRRLLPGQRLHALLRTCMDKLGFLLTPEVWHATLVAMQTRRMHRMTFEEWVSFAEMMEELASREDSQESQLEAQLLQVFHVIDPISGQQMSKHALMATAGDQDKLSMISRRCPFLLSILPPNVWTRTFLKRFMDHRAAAFLDFEEFREICIGAVHREEKLKRNAAVKIAEAEKVAERKRLDELDRLRLANMPEPQEEFSRLWAILAKTSGGGGKMRMRVQKRAILIGLREPRSKAQEFVTQSHHLQCLVAGDEGRAGWVKAFYVLPTKLPSDMNESEFSQFCQTAMREAKEASVANTESNARRQRGKRRDSAASRTLQALKESWLCEQELTRLWGEINTSGKESLLKREVREKLVLDEEVSALCVHSTRLRCITDFSRWQDKFACVKTFKQDRVNYKEFSEFFSAFIEKGTSGGRVKDDMKGRARTLDGPRFQQLRAAFNAIDADGNGVLDSRELLQAKKEAARKKAAAEEARMAARKRHLATSTSSPTSN